jgi:hypothetical protein
VGSGQSAVGRTRTESLPAARYVGMGIAPTCTNMPPKSK